MEQEDDDDDECDVCFLVFNFGLFLIKPTECAELSRLNGSLISILYLII